MGLELERGMGLGLELGEQLVQQLDELQLGERRLGEQQLGEQLLEHGRWQVHDVVDGQHGK